MWIKGKQMKRVAPAVVVLCVAMVSGIVSANEWTGAVDDRWDEPGNWSQGVIPLGNWQNPGSGWDDPASPFYPLTPDTSDDGPLNNNDAQIRYSGSPVNVSIDGTTMTAAGEVGALAYGVRVGNGGGDVTFRIDGGDLKIGGPNPSNPNGGREGWHFDIGRGFETNGAGFTQRVVMTGGNVETNGLLIPEQFVDETLPDPTDSAPLNGELIMSGGTITGRWMNLGQLKGNGTLEMSGDSVINVYPTQPTDINNGGHFSFNRNWFLFGQPVPSSGNVSLDISGNATINIFGTESELTNTPKQTEVDRYQGYIDDANDPLSNQGLTANGGTAEPIITLQPCPEAPDPLAELCVNDGGMMITITAPPSVTPGDFDGNGAFECADVDSLVAEIVAGTHAVSFDLTGDSLVDADDLDAWLGFAGTALGLPGPLLPADSNLDGTVDGQDFVRWNNFKFTSGNGFCGGDFNADGFTNGQDFVIWNTFKFQDSDVQAVPEPAGWMLMVGGLLWWRSRHNS
jgi:hypothetical protein